MPVTIPVCHRKSSISELYALMLSIRLFEQSLLDMFNQGILMGTTHTCIGQESTAVGVLSALDLEKDIVFSNHRGHGHFLSYCGKVEELYLEIMGKSGGLCGGRGGSQHLCDRNYYSNGVQGGIVPVASGMALAEKFKGTKAISVVFLGDGTLGEGVVYETLNMSSLWGVPVLFVVDNNSYAQSTPIELQLSGSIEERFKAFGIRTKGVSGLDVRNVLSAAVEIVDKIRQDSQPGCLIIDSVRMGPHSKGDDSRTEGEIKKAQEKDPLVFMEEMKCIENIDRIGQKVQSIINGVRGKVLSLEC